MSCVVDVPSNHQFTKLISICINVKSNYNVKLHAWASAESWSMDISGVVAEVFGEQVVRGVSELGERLGGVREG